MTAAGRERPLAGKRIVVTRPRAQATSLVEDLAALGAEAMVLPTIRVEGLLAPDALQALARRASDYDWIVFTSRNAVEQVAAVLEALALIAPAGRPRVCAVGPATAERIRRHGVAVDLVPQSHVAEAVAEALLRAGVGSGSRVLFPRAEEVRPVITESLTARGASVDEVVVYRTVPDGAGAPEVAAALADRRVDAVTFTSGSTVRRFVELIGTDLGGALTASIGPVTSRVLRECGLPANIEASEYTTRGLVHALTERLGTDASHAP